MGNYLNALTATRMHIRTLYVIVVFLMLVIAGLWYGWNESPKFLRISIPPDLRAGAIVRPDEFQAAQVFSFARIYFVALNRWEEDGEVDYPKKIQEMQSYITPSYRETLVEQMHVKKARGELDGRTRYSMPLGEYNEYKPEHVVSLPDGSWVVTLEVEIVEKVASLEAKRVKIRYPLRVVKINIDPSRNIWGLALDGTPEGYKSVRIHDDG